MGPHRRFSRRTYPRPATPTKGQEVIDPEETIIALFYERNGVLETTGDNYSLADFGGVVPVVGDLLPMEGVAVGKDRSDPDNRTVYEVVSRYFFPRYREQDAPQIGFEVRARAGTRREINILPG